MWFQAINADNDKLFENAIPSKNYLFAVEISSVLMTIWHYIIDS